MSTIRPLQLLSWNVRYFSHHLRGISSTERNLQLAAQAIASFEPQPDVLALQEIDNHSIRSNVNRFGRQNGPNGESPPQIVRFLEHLNRASVARGGHEYEAMFFKAHGHDAILSLYSTGLAILHRKGLRVVEDNVSSPHEITYRRIQRLARIKQKRICAWCRFADEAGHSFDLFNTHLSLPAFLQRANPETRRRFGEADNQLYEIQAVLDFIHERANLDRAVLVGDFNAVPGSRVYNHVIGGATRFRDAFATHFAISPDELRGIPSAGFMRMRFRLDHVFAGPKLNFVEFPHTLPFSRAHPLRGLSDHVPIMGTFTVRR